MKKKTKIIIIVAAIVLIAAIVTALVIILNNNKQFTVKFDTDGGSEIAEIKIKKNETLVLPKEPTKEGYVFLNWVDEEGNAVLKNFVVKKDKKLTAKWAKADEEIYTVTFNTDGGTTIPELKVVKGEKVILPENPTKEGYDFKAWVDKDGKEFDKETIIEEDIVLKATWEEVKEEEKKDDKKDDKKDEQTNNNQPANTTVEVTGISLDKSTVDLIIGGSGTLTATVTPADATNKSIVWSSSDSSVISVDGAGNLSAKAIGSATITAKTVNGKTASATVYSDVSSISLSASRTYITKYNGQTGAKSQTQLTVTVSPVVDSSLIVWSAPDASGPNAAAYFSGSGTSATITARDVWGSYNSSIPVTVSVGRKTSNKVTIYVEPQLNDLYFTEGSSIVNKNVNVKVNANIPVSWSFNSEQFAKNINRQSNWVSFTSYNDRTHQEGFVLSATTNAGQKKSVSISVNAK